MAPSPNLFKNTHDHTLIFFYFTHYVFPKHQVCRRRVEIRSKKLYFRNVFHSAFLEWWSPARNDWKRYHCYPGSDYGYDQRSNLSESRLFQRLIFHRLRSIGHIFRFLRYDVCQPTASHQHNHPLTEASRITQSIRNALLQIENLQASCFLKKDWT